MSSRAFGGSDRKRVQRRNTQNNTAQPSWDSASSTPTLVPSNSSSSRQTPISSSSSSSSTPQTSKNRIAYQIDLAPGSDIELTSQTHPTNTDQKYRRDTESSMFRETLSSFGGLLSTNNYTGLGQYPNKYRKIATKTWLRLAGLVVFIFGIGYFGIAALRSSGATDSDVYRGVDQRLQSLHCDIPHPGRPLVQYVLMLDAGSTGSRIHVYKFNYCKNHPELEDEIFEQLKPGLSSFPDDPKGAAHSLDRLMDVAMKGVPESLRSCTPIAVKATAGLRMLGHEKSDDILKAVEDHLNKDYPFKLIPESPVEIMDGKDEGIYAWITVNYLLGVLGDEGHNTAATFDLGGGSTQIVFEPRFENWNSTTGGPQMASGEHRYEMKYGGQEYTLYQHSYLGYGLMEARKSIKKLIAQEASASGKFSVEHPCFPPEFREELPADGNNSAVTIRGISKAALKSESALDLCYKEVKKILKKDAPCAQAPCSFNGVYQPELDKTFVDNPFYIFSYFYDRTYPLGVRDEFTLSDIKSLANKVCKHDLSLFADKEQQEIKKEDYCLDLSFQYALLRDGVGMPENRVVRSTRKIKDAETGWCLGASLAVLDQHEYCKFKKIY